MGDSGALDLNSLYCYLLLCSDFADTSVVACGGSAVLGFVMAYRPPPRRHTVFVWQIGVAAPYRGQRLGNRLLHELIALPACRDVFYLEATVTPSNTASRRLFQSFAGDLAVPCQVSPRFAGELFGTGNHEAEEQYRIGPITHISEEAHFG